MEKFFNSDRFVSYLSKKNFVNNFNRVEESYLHDLIENIVNYAYENENTSKDQFCYFLSDLLPDVEFGDVAMFTNNKYLTGYGKNLKEIAIDKFLKKTFTKDERERLNKIKDRIDYAYETGNLQGLTLAEFTEVEDCYNQIMELENRTAYTLDSKVKDVFQNAGFKISLCNNINYEISLN